MKPKYISEIITEDDIKLWKPGNRILISSQTGTGKSEFIRTQLYMYAKENRLKILLLTNRDLLKNQTHDLLEMADKLDIITIKNYQMLEASELKGWEADKIFDNFDIIVYDEAHYIFSDSQFNRNTDIMIRPIQNTPKKIFIFLTATPDILLFYQPKFDYIYTIPIDYSYIENLYFYHKQETLDFILPRIPLDEKCIFFVSDAFDGYQISVNYPNAKFICSEKHKDLGRFTNKQTSEEIRTKSKFEGQLLCATKVLDNGVNIIDSAVKHIIIDMLDPITLIQCLGRKRIADGEKINLYIHHYTRKNILAKLDTINDKLSQVDERQELGKRGFQEEYKRKDFDNVIQNDFEINYAKLNYYQFLRDFYKETTADIYDKGYDKYICNKLNFPYDQTELAENHFEKITLETELTKFIGIKLYKEDQEKFKNMFFNNIFSPKKTDYRKRGDGSINAILIEDKIAVRLITYQERKGAMRGQRVWELISKKD